MRDEAMAQTLRRLAIEAGAVIMEIYSGDDLGQTAKADDSPVTLADLAADRVICDGLSAAHPDIPVVTEERAETHGLTGIHFLVDPLDGTKEFIQRRGDFTVNIALIESGAPVAGVVYAPARARLFRTMPDGGACEETGAMARAVEGPLRRLRVTAPPAQGWRVVASKSHRDPQTEAYLAGVATTEIKSAGSSLKFCLLAAGEADLYPRFGPTMHWDTAAADAVLRASGGRVLRLPDLTPMRYAGPERLNPGFIAVGAGEPPHPA